MAIFTFENQWDVFKLMALQELLKAGYKNNAQSLAECLDYSFEEDYLNTDIDTWRERMIADIEEMKKDCPEDFL